MRTITRKKRQTKAHVTKSSNGKLSLAKLCEAVLALNPGEREKLLARLKREQIKAERAEILRDIEAGRAEYAAGLLKPGTPAEIVRRALR